MALTKWRRPHSITLPGGFRIPIVYWSARKMAAAQKRDPTMAKQDLLGYWDGQRIVIGSNEPLWVQIEVLGHEVLHAVHDWAIYLKQAYVDPIQSEAGETLLEQRDEEGE